MNWLFLLVVLGQAPPHHTIQEIRATVNRLDDLDKTALQAKAKQEAATLQSESNQIRRVRLIGRLKTFAVLDLNHTPPLQDAEIALITNIADEAAKPYDVHPKAVTSSPTNKVELPVTGWYQVNINGHILEVWGTFDPTIAKVRWNIEQQPLQTRTLYNTIIGPQSQIINVQERTVLRFGPQQPILFRTAPAPMMGIRGTNTCVGGG